MDRIHDAAYLLFARMSAEKLLDVLLVENRRNANEAWTSLFLKQARLEPRLTWQGDAQLTVLDRMVRNEWSRSPLGAHVRGQGSAFHVLARAVSDLIINHDYEPRICHRHILKWRELALHLTPDLLMCANLAWDDRFVEHQQRRLAWPLQPRTDNRTLEAILGKGLAENHAHMYATAPIFEASWLALMLNPTRHKDEMNEWSRNQLDPQINASAHEELSLVQAVRLAAAIRQHLWRALTLNQKGNELQDLRAMFQFWDRPDWDPTSLMVDHFQGLIDAALAHRKGNLHDVDARGPMDYAGAGSAVDRTLLVHGERSLMYRLMHQIFRDPDPETEALFHAYLLLKHRFRREVVQLNGRKGFGNFKFYQDRKKEIIAKYPRLQQVAVKEALSVSRCVHGREHEKMLAEFRFGPKSDSRQLRKAIEGVAESYAREGHGGQGWRNSVEEELWGLVNSGIFFTLHFFKRLDKQLKEAANDSSRKPDIPLELRDGELRKLVRQQANAILDLRAEDQVFHYLIRGIDAASVEFNARPEVFAPEFRRLRRFRAPERDGLPILGVDDANRLRVTFHAGEDFHCLTDGLRYVEEAIRLLDYQNGDRIGHGLSLGVSVRNFFKQRKEAVLVPCQELLDNLIWVKWMAGRFTVQIPQAEVERIDMVIEQLLENLYPRHINPHIMRHYRDAYRLRGDDPTIYEDLSKWQFGAGDSWRPPPFPDADDRMIWKGTEQGFDLDQFRKQKEVVQIHHDYCFNTEVRWKGFNSMIFKITEDYQRVLEGIQLGLLRLVERRHIGIECNLSSNVLIGPINRFDEHPILRFYNRELLRGRTEGLPPIFKDSPQLMVSINTDDAGIFGTSLENEYALMATALERMKGEDGERLFEVNDIYAWLDQVRNMGMLQSFASRKHLK